MPSSPLCSAYGLLVIVALTLSASGSVAITHHDDYKLIQITPQRSSKDLMAFLESSEFDIWRPSSGPGDPAEIKVSPEDAAYIKTILFKNAMKYGLYYIRELDMVVHRLNLGVDSKFRSGDDEYVEVKQDPGPFSWLKYYTIDSINAWLERMAANYRPIAQLISTGKTASKRKLVGLRIAHRPNLPIVFVTAVNQASEWIGAPTAAWFIQEVLEGNRDVLKDYEWHVFPVVNPDGYHYTQLDRSWEKNINPAMGGTCYGVNLNRNWPMAWRKGEGPCSPDFPGATPNSEGETQGLMSYMNNTLDRIKVYFSLRGHGEALLYPWSFTKMQAKDTPNFIQVARKVRRQLYENNGIMYDFNSVANVIKKMSGTPIDYAYYMGVQYPFEFWHRYMDDEEDPSKNILPIANEALDVVTIILQEAL